jgi:hypothetical protein
LSNSQVTFLSLPRLQSNSGLPKFDHPIICRSRIYPTSAGGQPRALRAAGGGVCEITPPGSLRSPPSPFRGGIRKRASVSARILCGAGYAVVPPSPLRASADKPLPPGIKPRVWRADRRSHPSCARTVAGARRLSARHGRLFCPRDRNFRARTGGIPLPDPGRFRRPSSAPRPAS